MKLLLKSGDRLVDATSVAVVPALATEARPRHRLGDLPGWLVVAGGSAWVLLARRILVELL